jgi:PAS domain S-box-containing protein
LLNQFAEQSQQLVLERGFGLPGHVWQSRETHWIESLAADGNFVRKRIAAEAGLTSGVALPIDIGSKVYGVLEFFTVARLEGDPPLQDMLMSLGNEIGQFIVRKRLDEDLRDEEARKSEILKAALDAIITMDQEGRIVDFNPAAERIFGFTQAEMKGQLLSETIIPHEYREAHVAGFSRYLKTGTGKVLGRRLELTALRKDGTTFPVELAISASNARGGAPFFTAHMRDITEHKQFVHSIIDRDNRITALLNSTAEGIYGIDLNGLCSFANASAAKILGYASPDDLVGKHMHESIHHTRPNGEPYPVENCKIYNAFRLGESVHINDELYWRADGTSFNVEYWSYPQVHNGKVIGCVVSFLDITERKAAEAERTNRETQLQLALTAGKLGAFQWDIATNDIGWSEQVYDIFGCTREQFNGKLDGFFSLLHPDDLKLVRQTIEAELASDSDRHELEFRAVRVSDGQVIWVQSFGKIERDERGKPLRMAGLVSDFTERKQLLNELSDREAQLRRVIDNTLGFIGVLDTQGILQEINQTALVAGGISRSDVIGKPFPECYWWSYDDQVAENLKAAIATALTGIAVRYDVVIRMAGDARMAIDFMLAPVKDALGNVTHLIPSGVDISERKVAELEVQQRVNQLNLALASGRMALWEWDIATDHVTLSSELYQSFGCTVETFEPTKAGFLKIVHKDDRQKLELMIQSAFNSNCENHEVEFRVVRGDNGEIVWNHSRGTIRRGIDGNPTSILSVSVDVTERKQRELTLTFLAELQSGLTGFSAPESIIAEASQKVAEYLQLSHCMMVRMDNDARQATVEFDHCTDGSDSLLGIYDMAEFANEDERRQLSAGLPMVVNDTASPTRSANVIKNYAALKIGAVLNAPSSRDENLRFMLSATKRNAHAWREDEVQLMRELANILRFKLDRAHAESALRESEAKFRDLADNISQFAWMTDAKGSIFWYNQRWFDYTGSTLEEMLDWGWKSVQHPDHLERVVRHWVECLENGKVWEDTFPLRSRDGEYRWFLSRAQPIRDQAGSIVRWFGTNTDITEAKQGEEALRASQEQLRLGVDVAQFALAQVDYDQDCIHLTSQAAKLYGFGDEEIVVSRSKIHEVFHPDDQQKIIDGVAHCLDPSSDGELAIAHRVILPDGQIRWLDVRLRVSFDRSALPPRPLIGILAVQDITNKMHWELALAESKERLSMAMDSARMGTFEWEPNSDRATWDDQHRALTGLTSENMKGSDFFKLIHPEDAIANQLSLDRLITGEKDYEAEFRIRRTDGTVCWLAGRGKIVRAEDDRPLKFVGLNWDITEAKEQEQRIRESEERLRSAAQAAGFGTVYVDLLTHSATFSDELRTIIGLPGDEQELVSTHEIPDWIYINDRNDFAAFVQELANLQEGKSSSIDLRIVRSSNEVIWVRLLAKPIFSGVAPMRKPTQVIGTVLDITKQREFERSLDEARALAEAANESKSAFLANMSHEIRTPMTAILGYTDLVADSVQDADAAAHLQTIRRNGYFLLDIINDILDLSKIEAGMLDITCERFMPNQLVEDVRSIMEVRAVENNLTLEVEYVGLIPTEIESDAKRLKQILINLIGNAIKFTKKGSVKVVVSYGDQSLKFDIIDTGIGMNRRQLDRLFQPFSQGDQTVNREFGGTGLGLAISQRLATMLGGNIVVKSEKNKGSTFTVTIATGNVSDVQFVKPLLAIPPKVEPPKPVTVELDCRILVVDDRRDIRHLSRRILTGVGASVTEAEDGQVAIQTVMQSIAEGKTFDLILLDMQMPRLDGYETAKRLRSLGFGGPIIALTADAMQGDMSRCIASGCNDYLSKPIDKSVMLKLVSDYVSGSPKNAPDKKLEA